MKSTTKTLARKRRNNKRNTYKIKFNKINKHKTHKRKSKKNISIKKGGKYNDDKIDMIYKSFIELYIDIYYTKHYNNNTRVKKNTNYIKEFVNIYEHETFKLHGKTLLDETKQEAKIKEIITKRLIKKNDFAQSESNKQIPMLLDCHGTYSTHDTNLYSLPSNIIICHLTPTNRYAFGNYNGFIQFRDIIYKNKDNYYKNGLSCFRKNNFNDKCFKYMHVYYDYYPNMDLNMGDNDGKEMGLRAFNNNTNMDYYFEKRDLKKKYSITLDELISNIYERNSSNKVILFMNTCLNIDHNIIKKFIPNNNKNFDPFINISQYNLNNYATHENLVIQYIYILEKINELLNFFIDDCNKNIKLINGDKCETIYFNKYIDHKKSTHIYKHKPTLDLFKEKLYYNDNRLTPRLTYFWLFIVFNLKQNNANFDINGKYTNGKSLILLAIDDDLPEILKLIIKNPMFDKKLINEKDNDGRTPLMYSIENKNNINVIKLLLKLGSDVNQFDKNKNSIIHYIIESKNIEILKLILGHKEFDKKILNMKNRNLTTPLLLCIYTDDSSMMNLLIKAGADINYVDVSGSSLIHIMADRNMYSMLIPILKNSMFKKELLNKKDDNLYTPLMYSIRNNNKYIVELLLDAGTQISKDKYLLLFAIGHKKEEDLSIIKLLILNGINLKYNDTDYDKILKLSESNDELYELMQKNLQDENGNYRYLNESLSSPPQPPSLPPPLPSP